MSTGPSFSISSLHSRVLDRLKHWNPIYDAERLLLQGSDGRFQDKERRKTPIYISLNKERSSRSIEIVPRLGFRREKSIAGSSPLETPVQDTDENLAAMTEFLKDDRYKHVEVTLSIQVETGQILRPNDMVNWIQDMPLLAKSVRLQALVPSMSTLLILSLPVSTWNLLPSNLACSFLGFTNSMNLLLPNYYENIFGWLNEVAENTGSELSASSDGLVSDVSWKTPSVTTEYPSFQKGGLSINAAMPQPGRKKVPQPGRKKVPQLHEASTLYKILDKLAKKTSIEGPLPRRARVPKSIESRTFDPIFRSISPMEASEFWVAGRVNFPRHSLLSDLPYVLAHDCLGI